MEIQQELIRGSVVAVVYQNNENGYAVIRLAAEDGQTITVVGTIPMTTVGERLLISGKWGYHTSYGRQFEAEFLERMMPRRTDLQRLFLITNSGRSPPCRGNPKKTV